VWSLFMVVMDWWWVWSERGREEMKEREIKDD
jgi:hypothetical protein